MELEEVTESQTDSQGESQRSPEHSSSEERTPQTKTRTRKRRRVRKPARLSAEEEEGEKGTSSRRFNTRAKKHIWNMLSSHGSGIVLLSFIFT